MAIGAAASNLDLEQPLSATPITNELAARAVTTKYICKWGYQISGTGSTPLSYVCFFSVRASKLTSNLCSLTIGLAAGGIFGIVVRHLTPSD